MTDKQSGDATNQPGLVGRMSKAIKDNPIAAFGVVTTVQLFIFGSFASLVFFAASSALSTANSVSTRVDSASTRFDAAVTRIDNLITQTSDTNARVQKGMDELKQAYVAVDTRLNHVGDDLVQLKGDQAAAKTAVENATTQIALQLRDTNSKIDTRFDSLNTRFDGVMTELARMSSERMVNRRRLQPADRN